MICGFEFAKNHSPLSRIYWNYILVKLFNQCTVGQKLSFSKVKFNLNLEFNIFGLVCCVSRQKKASGMNQSGNYSCSISQNEIECPFRFFNNEQKLLVLNSNSDEPQKSNGSEESEVHYKAFNFHCINIPPFEFRFFFLLSIVVLL